MIACYLPAPVNIEHWSGCAKYELLRYALKIVFRPVDLLGKGQKTSGKANRGEKYDDEKVGSK